MSKKLRRQLNFKMNNFQKHSNALFEKKIDTEPEGDELQLDVEWGRLPAKIEEIQKEEQKKLDAAEGGAPQGGAKKEAAAAAE
jgi:hypothetical protein